MSDYFLLIIILVAALSHAICHSILKENKKIDSELGIITIDSVFTPVKNVKYSIENYRVEQKTDYEKLIFEINTDGSIHPKDALTEAAKTLIHHFLFSSAVTYPRPFSIVNSMFT